MAAKMTNKRTQSERIARLEAHDSIDHKRLEKLEKNMIPVDEFRTVEKQVQAIHDKLMEDKGAKRAYRAVAAACVSLISIIITIWSKGKFW
jgi:hypothetical protein